MEAAKLTGIVAFILALAGIFGWLISYDQVPFKVATLINGLHLARRCS